MDYTGIAKEAGFTEWEIENCPRHLVENTTVYQMARIRVAIRELWAEIVRRLPS